MDKQKQIGILTFHRALNYGAAIQAYALTQYLTEAGFDAEVIDYCSARHNQNVKHFVQPTGISTLRRDIYSYITLDYLKRRDIDFAAFIKRNVKISKDTVDDHSLSDKVKRYNAVICGSDQIWNPRLSDRSKAFFLPECSGVKKIAYAASVGKGRLGEYERPDVIRKALEEFSAISVREESSRVKLSQFYRLTSPIEIVVDPTLLINTSDYIRIAGPRQVAKPYIFLYTVEGRQDTVAAAKKISELVGLPIYTLFPGKPKSCWIRMRKSIAPGDLGPAGFLAMIRDAEYIVTDSFHGSVLSMLFHKNYFIIARKDEFGKMIRDERIAHFCDTFNQNKRYILADELNETVLSIETDWREVEQCRITESDKSKAFLQRALNENEECYRTQNRLNYAGMSSLCPPDQCTGCGGCIAVCGVNAIAMAEAKDGRMLPQVDSYRCVHCGKCEKACPQLHQPEFQRVIRCYAAQWKNNEERVLSSTSGIASLLAYETIRSGGIVFGAAVDEDLCVRHKMAVTDEEAKQFRTSKYAQSDMTGVYREIREKLNDGTPVLFTGTPCQVAAVRRYIGPSDDNLFCLETICHGVPPMSYLREHIQKLHGAARDYRFRGGTTDNLFTLVGKDNQILLKRVWWKDEYYFSFSKNISLRENCYACPYARPERVADITVGDFWKLDRSTLKTKMDGRISVVLINNEKGERLWKMIEDQLDYEERTLKEALNGNPNLQKPSEISPSRRHFLEKYNETGSFERAFHESRAGRDYRKYHFRKTLIGRFLVRLKHTLH